MYDLVVIKFAKKCLLFLLPIGICVFVFTVLMDVFILNYPSSFNRKVDYFKNNLDSIQCLFLGSSHCADAINPEFISLKSANMAYGNQDYQLDSAIFFHYINSLKKLKSVFIEVDYHSLESKNEESYHRYSWYYKFLDINITKLNFTSKWCLYLSNNDNRNFFEKQLKSVLFEDSYQYKINKYGYITNELNGVFADLNYNDSLIKETSSFRLRKRHVNESITNYNFNKRKITSVINYCLKNNIHVFLVKYPVYYTYIEKYKINKLKRRDLFIDSLLQDKRITLLDFESDRRFDIFDYYNDDHLNANGGKKFSMILNEIIECSTTNINYK